MLRLFDDKTRQESGKKNSVLSSSTSRKIQGFFLGLKDIIPIMEQKHLEADPTVDELRRAIPDHCFERSTAISLSYLLRDIFYVTVLIFGALKIPSIQSISIRMLAWISYGFLQGLVGTGLWILAHECGHGAFSPYRRLNETIGWTLHSSLLVPYFSWKITHARHHRYTGHMDKDTAFVPPTEEQLVKKTGIEIEDLQHLTQDTPITTLVNLIGIQLVGWPLYLAFYTTGGQGGFPEGTVAKEGIVSHFDPYGPLFSQKQRSMVLLSDLGILIVGSLLFLAGSRAGFLNIVLLYFVPYLWVHHWLVAITYLHHTDLIIPHYAATTWSFKKGALGTIDRSFGFIGRHFFHDIIDHHVVHHFFPKIPFYRAEEATAAIKPLLGPAYVERKDHNFLSSLWTTFRECRFVSDSVSADVRSGIYKWK